MTRSHFLDIALLVVFMSSDLLMPLLTVVILILVRHSGALPFRRSAIPEIRGPPFLTLTLSLTLNSNPNCNPWRQMPGMAELRNGGL